MNEVAITNDVKDFFLKYFEIMLIYIYTFLFLRNHNSTFHEPLS